MCVVGIQLTFSCTRFFDYERKTRYITGNHLKTIVIPSPNAWSEDYRTNARFRKPTRLSSAQPFFSHFPSLISQCPYSLPAYPCVYFLVLTTHVRIPRLPPHTITPLHPTLHKPVFRRVTSSLPVTSSLSMTSPLLAHGSDQGLLAGHCFPALGITNTQYND